MGQYNQNGELTTAKPRSRSSAKSIIKSLVALILVCSFALRMTSDSSAAQAEWQAAWEKTLAAAENEGEVGIYSPFGTQYEAAIRAFEKSYPKIKVNYVPGSGTANSQRIMAERRAGKYLADAFISGPGSQLTMAKGKVLAPVAEALILPEAKDQTAWLRGKHLYADPEERYVFVFGGDVSYSFGVYNKNQVKPDEIKSHWDVLKPKSWAGSFLKSSAIVLFCSPSAAIKIFLEEERILIGVLTWLGEIYQCRAYFRLQSEMGRAMRDQLG